MEKYLRHEPHIKLGKKSRLSSGNRRSSWSDVFSSSKSTSVDDILAIKEEVDIKREMSDQVDRSLRSVVDAIKLFSVNFTLQ